MQMLSLRFSAIMTRHQNFKYENSCNQIIDYFQYAYVKLTENSYNRKKFQRFKLEYFCAEFQTSLVYVCKAFHYPMPFEELSL